MKAKCKACDTDYINEHSKEKCLTIQLSTAKKKIEKLELSVDAWKEAWYRYRALIGRIINRAEKFVQIRLD
jgi:hypothetical protein